MKYNNTYGVMHVTLDQLRGVMVLLCVRAEDVANSEILFRLAEFEVSDGKFSSSARVR